MERAINPFQVEKDFRKIKDEIDLNVHNREHFIIPDEDLFIKLDEEYNEVKKVYKGDENLHNLYHVKHNYNSTKVYQYLDKKDNYKSLNLFLIDEIKSPSKSSNKCGIKSITEMMN